MIDIAVHGCALQILLSLQTNLMARYVADGCASQIIPALEVTVAAGYSAFVLTVGVARI